MGSSVQPNAPSASGGSTRDEGRASVLIVDDEATNIRVMAQLLRTAYEVKVATSGERCLELCAHGPLPDLVLLDISMPGMDGHDVCRRLKADPVTEHIPVIFVTGRDLVTDEEEGLRLGAVDYITKPISPAIMLARVHSHITLKRQRDQLQRMASRDQLTGVYNRHHLMDYAAHAVAEASEQGLPLCLLMLDLDHFKPINDTHGHLAGDRVLVEVARLLERESGKGATVARFGGEEFLVLLEGQDLIGAATLAERLRQKIATLFPLGLQVSASFGVARLESEHDAFHALIERADNAVYRSKEEGRNRVTVNQGDRLVLQAA